MNFSHERLPLLANDFIWHNLCLLIFYDPDKAVYMKKKLHQFSIHTA